MFSQLARAHSSVRTLLFEGDGDSVGDGSSVASGGGHSVDGELDIIESAVLNLRSLLDDDGVDGLVVHALSWLDNLHELDDTLGVMQAERKGDPTRVQTLRSQLGELCRRINALLRRGVDEVAKEEAAVAEAEAAAVAEEGEPRFPDEDGGGLEAADSGGSSEEEGSAAKVDARDLYRFQPEWGGVPGLMPSEQLSVSRTWNVRIPDIEDHSVLRKLVLEAADLGVANMMHHKISQDAQTYHKSRRLRIQRGRPPQATESDRPALTASVGECEDITPGGR